MPSQLPLWLQYTQALAVPLLALVIAGFGTWIALQQMQIARVKLRHDLYDRRFAVFEATRKLLTEVLVDAAVSYDQVRAYVACTSASVFLLNEEISTYLEEIHKRANRLQNIKHSMNAIPAQRTALADEEAQILSWLIAQLPELATKFKPFLMLDKRKPEKRRSWFTAGGFLHLVGRARARSLRHAA